MRNYLLLIILNVSISLWAQTGFNTSSASAKLEVLGSSASPASSGSAINGILRLSEGSNANLKAIDFGINGNNFSWLQPRLNTDYSSNHSLLLNPNGGAIIIGNTSGTQLLNVGGNVTATGTIRSTSAGQLLNTVILDESDLSISSSQTISNSQVTLVSRTYTPVSSSSKIIIEFHSKFSVLGTNNDQWRSYLIVNGTTLQTQTNVWTLSDGAGGRGSTMFPIRAVYSNTTGNQITIKIDVQEISGDDSFTIYPDMILTIKEVAQ